ncbi:MAG TPA: nucleotide sugar dehydrogenase [Terriglobales bacterium]|jgi:UDPglucose 6-dehydrogenase|nr:nucleotide sugar dehydrogenase [Terriglobales bacterium]
MSLEQTIQNIGVVGLGKLGACVAACLASRGFNVIGIDADQAKIEAIQNGRAPVEEPRLQDKINEGGSRLRATTSFAEVVKNSEACFFITPTPSLPDGSFDNQYLIRALQSVADEVRKQNKKNYLFNVNSTVTPGTCDSIFKSMLEKMLAGSCGKDFGLGYNPEFIALGNVVRGLLEPDLVLVGESDPQTGERLEELYRRFCTNNAPIERMSCANAELTKISVNCAVTMKISFVNQLSAVCAKIPGTDPGVILRAIGRDRRIGSEYLKPGLGYGGPCFPRDNRLFQYTAKSVGVDAPLARATDQVNEQVNTRLLQTVMAHAPNGNSVAVLGLAYKPLSNVVECSTGVWLCQQLASHGASVFAHDYAANGNAEASFSPGKVQLVKDPSELLNCSVFVITCPWPEYREVFKSSKHRLKQGSVIIDPWSMLRDVVPVLEAISYVDRLN